ncbi:MAG: hypothetical protein WC884_01815 [Candidatus Paceibacterota bacterium]
MDSIIEKKRLFKTLANSIILLFLVNFFAVKFYWYYFIWYFDMSMHFFGGFCAGLVSIWLLSFLYSSFKLTFNLIIKIVLGVLVFGILWEVFEILVNNITVQNSFNTLDTISDIFFDLVGGLFAILYFFFYFLKKIIQNTESKLQLP